MDEALWGLWIYLRCQPQEFKMAGSPEAASRWPRKDCENGCEEGIGLPGGFCSRLRGAMLV